MPWGTIWIHFFLSFCAYYVIPSNITKHIDGLSWSFQGGRTRYKEALITFCITIWIQYLFYPLNKIGIHNFGDCNGFGTNQDVFNDYIFVAMIWCLKFSYFFLPLSIVKCIQLFSTENLPLENHWSRKCTDVLQTRPSPLTRKMVNPLTRCPRWRWWCTT